MDVPEGWVLEDDVGDVNASGMHELHKVGPGVLKSPLPPHVPPHLTLPVDDSLVTWYAKTRGTSQIETLIMVHQFNEIRTQARSRKKIMVHQISTTLLVQPSARRVIRHRWCPKMLHFRWFNLFWMQLRIETQEFRSCPGNRFDWQFWATNILLSFTPLKRYIQL